MSKRAKTPRPEVRVGQVWEDCDPRMTGRQLRVEKVEGGYAILRRCFGDRQDTRTTKIRLSRMYPHSTGFRLVQSASGVRMRA